MTVMMTTDEVLQALAAYKRTLEEARTLEVKLSNHFFPLIEEKLRQKDKRGALDLLEHVPQGHLYYRLWNLIQKAK